ADDGEGIGGGRVHRVASSSTAAARNSTGSARAGPSSCTPTGRPSSPAPKGTDSAGWPARLDGMVHTSLRYIASGSALSPKRKAVVGEVGDTRTSTCS